jgi:hypothetical protein
MAGIKQEEKTYHLEDVVADEARVPVIHLSRAVLHSLHRVDHPCYWVL